MAEYSRLAQGVVTSVLTGSPTSVILPFTPDFIEISNSTRATAASGVTRAWWESDMGQGAAMLVTTSAGPADGTSFITTGGFSTFSAGLSQQFGPTLAIASITQSATIPLVTTTTDHNLVSGNVVIFQALYESSSTGMQQIAGIPFVVTVTAPTTFTIQGDNNGSNYTALTGSPAGATVKQVLYPNLYAPNVGFIGFLTLGGLTVVTTTAPTNFKIGQEVAFRIPQTWGTTQLNSLPDVLIPGSPIYGYVTAVNSATQFVVNINSTGYTAFNPNQVFASFPGQNFPQVVAVGDVNSCGNPFTGFQLYPSPTFYNGMGTGTRFSINGPSIQGAFSNNTSMGFIIGGSISGTTADSIYWRAYLNDYNS